MSGQDKKMGAPVRVPGRACDDGVSQSPDKRTKDLPSTTRRPRVDCCHARAGAAFFLEVAQRRHTFVIGTADADENVERVLYMTGRS
jgi:hypothetical protein